MKVEYVCVVTLDERDIRLAAANGGTAIEHPVPPVRTILRVGTDARDARLGRVDNDAADSVPWGVSARDGR